MNRADVEAFRTRVRVSLIERLVLKIAFQEPVLNHQLSGQESREVLIEWLESNSTAADSAYGAHFRGDAAQAALYADELKEIVDQMKKTVNECFESWREIYEP